MWCPHFLLLSLFNCSFFFMYGGLLSRVALLRSFFPLFFFLFYVAQLLESIEVDDLAHPLLKCSVWERSLWLFFFLFIGKRKRIIIEAGVWGFFFVAAHLFFFGITLSSWAPLFFFCFVYLWCVVAATDAVVYRVMSRVSVIEKCVLLISFFFLLTANAWILLRRRASSFFFFLRFPLSAVFQTTAYKSLLKTSKHTHTHTQEKGYLENCAQVACAVFGFMFLASHTCVTGVCEWTSNLKRKEHNNHRKNNSNDILFRPQWDWTQEKIACVCACVFRWAGTCGCEADWASFLKRNGSIGSLSRRTHIIFYLKVRGSLHAVNCTADADGEKPCAAVYFFILFFARCFTTAFTPIFPFLFFSFSYLSVNTHYFHQLKRQQGETLRRTSTCFCFQQNTIFIALGKKKTDFFFFFLLLSCVHIFFVVWWKKKREFSAS